MCQPSNARDDVVKLSEDEDVAPTNPVAKHWIRLRKAVPRINFPFTELDISFAVCSAFFLYAVRLVISYVLISVLKMPGDDPDTILSVGSLAAVVHALNLIPGLIVVLISQPYEPTSSILKAPKWYQELVDTLLQFCTGYMIYDSVASFLMVKGFAGIEGSDYLFLGHHIATAIYMSQTRALKAGHISAIICMVLGEISNPFQNGSVAVNHALLFPCCNGPFMHQLHYVLNFMFAFTYFGIRAIIAPVVFLHLTLKLLFATTRTNIPFVTRIFWILMIWGVELGSYAWIKQCWHILNDYIVGPSDNGSTADEL